MTEEELHLMIRERQLGKSIDLAVTAEELTVLIRWEGQLRESRRPQSRIRTSLGEVIRTPERPKLDFNDEELRREIPRAELDAKINKAKESLARCRDTALEIFLAKLERLKALRELRGDKGPAPQSGQSGHMPGPIEMGAVLRDVTHKV